MGVAAWLVWAMVARVAAFAVVLALPGEASSTVAGPLGIAALWTSAAVCWLAVARGGHRHRETVRAAAAVTAFGGGMTYSGVVWATGGSLPLPSPADVGELLFYPLILAAVDAAVRRHVRALTSSLWWDVAVGSLGAATVLAVVLRPVLDPALAGSPSLATAVAVAYPLFDLALVAAVVGIAALRFVRIGTRWGLLVAGLLLFTAADVVYALQQAAGVFVVGTPLDAGWAIGLALIALWVDGTARGDGPTRRPASGAATRTTVLVVPVVATAAALVVLAMATWTPLSRLAVVLAVVTLLVAAARTQVAFGELARMADLRRLEATTDLLTGLANRALFASRLAQALSRPYQTAVAVLFLDLDRFKAVNDSLGHDAGDDLLRQVADRLNACALDCDLAARARSRVTPVQDTIARLGGDEFTIMLADIDEGTLPQKVAARIVTQLEQPFRLGDTEVFISGSVGVATGYPGQTTPDALMRDADTALYHAKWNGRNRYEVFDPAMRQRERDRLRLQGDLRRAVDQGALTLAYQPIMDLATGKVIAVEALLRWHHPELGDISPTEFVSIAEETNLIVPIGRWVIGEACRQTAAWRGNGLPDLGVNVNISPRQFDDAGLVEHIHRTLTATGLPPAALCLEITETLLMKNVAQAIEILNQFNALGVRTAIDDFGAGNSSLRYLKDFPVDVIKVDCSIVAELGRSPSSTAIFEPIIMLGNTLDIDITAEGIETSRQLRILTDLHCPTGQGFFLTEPLPADEIPGRLLPGIPVDTGVTFPAQHDPGPHAERSAVVRTAPRP